VNFFEINSSITVKFGFKPTKSGDEECEVLISPLGPALVSIFPYRMKAFSTQSLDNRLDNIYNSDSFCLEEHILLR